MRWQYQWIVVQEFLPHTVGQPMTDDVLTNGPKFYRWRNDPFIPVEFSVAAYRFGHSQVRPATAPTSAPARPTPPRERSTALDCSTAADHAVPSKSTHALRSEFGDLTGKES